MRIFTSAIALSLILSSVVIADEAVVADVPPKTEAGKTTLGPLSPDDARLDDLFARLKRERNAETATAIATEIRQTFSQSGSATVDMLMANAARALDEKRFAAALDFADMVTLTKPDYAEGWNRRATIHYVMGNYEKSMSDCARVLALEPRHLGAMSGMASILQESGKDTRALEIWQAYLDLYPADRDAQKQVLDLLDEVAGSKT